MADLKRSANRIEFGPVLASRNPRSRSALRVVTNGLNFQLPEHFEIPRKHDQESRDLLCGIKEWRATTIGERNGLIRDEDRSAKLND
jgi:hypothetical protein